MSVKVLGRHNEKPTNIDIIAQLKNYDKLYVMGMSPISDVEYDKLREDAKKQFPNHPYFNTVGVEVESNKVKLPVVLGSLDKKYGEDFTTWNTKYKGKKVISCKLDGASVLCIFKKGKLDKAYTRGDGEYGVDITDKMRCCVPDLDEEVDMTVRGECLLVGDTHKELGYKNRRNGVVGIINRKDSIEECDKIKVIFYELVDSPDMSDLGRELSRLGYIRTFGLNVVPYDIRDEITVDFLNRFLVEMRQIHNFDMDGLVITVDESEREDTLIPEKKVAYKVNLDAVLAKVIGVEWNTGRTGRVVPTVLIEPTDIGGVTVSRATGFNAQFIQNNKITIGSRVALVRSGEVIPHIEYVLD